ncbi:hypothetical protein AgCh_012088 [Apium graveolens]
MSNEHTQEKTVVPAKNGKVTLFFKPDNKNVKTGTEKGMVKVKAKHVKKSGMSSLNYFFRLQVSQRKDGIFISQSKYIRELLKNYNLEDSTPSKTPMPTTTKLDQDKTGKKVDITSYRGMIGFQAKPKETHRIAVKRIFRYLVDLQILVFDILKHSNVSTSLTANMKQNVDMLRFVQDNSHVANNGANLDIEFTLGNELIKLSKDDLNEHLNFSRGDFVDPPTDA